ncbi:homoserine kinase [Leekyejoonella antrihumi]|uniref:homoserine kinase n=1 Tax=Leekyejoonella antrihumi TaxID=1660198 RepID=UPI001FEAFDE0|nr:homoserine kinase [Leekyejoonella antrihumi]
MGDSVTVRTPASTANLGPGFDSIGLALGLIDEVVATVEPDGLTITVAGHGDSTVPLDEGHLIWQSMCAMWERLEVDAPAGLRLDCRNAVPHSRGLGSSATAIVAGAGSALALAGVDLSAPEALTLVNDVAGDIEGHPDNASASVYGGLTLSWRDDERAGWRTVRPPLHPDIVPVVLVPDATLSTDKARSALAATLPLRDAASTAGRAALLIEAMTRRPDLLLPATREWLHQEARRPAYAPSMALVDRLRADGLAAVISGAGPTVLVLAAVRDVPRITAPDAGWQILTPGVPDTGIRAVSHSGASKV